MRRGLVRWLTVALLCCAASVAFGGTRADKQREQARTAISETQALLRAGRYDAAIARGEQALALAQKVFGDTHPAVAACLLMLGAAHAEQGDMTQAEPLLRHAVELAEATGREEPGVLADALSTLGGVYLRQKQYARAAPLFERSLALEEASLGKDDPGLAGYLSRLARCYSGQQDYHRAEPLLQRAIALLEAQPGQRSPEFADILNDLAILYAEQGDSARARPLFERVLALREETLGKKHPAVADALENLARTWGQQGELSRAELLWQRALTLREETLGQSDPRVATSLLELGSYYQEQGQYARAEPLLERALAILQKAPDVAPLGAADALLTLATLAEEQGRYSLAEQRYLSALRTYRAYLDKDDPRIAATLNGLAILYRKQGSFAQAEALFQRALAIKEAAFGGDHPSVARGLANLANVYISRGEYARAEPLYQRALAIYEKAWGSNHPSVAQALTNLAGLYISRGEYARAEPLCQRALAIYEASRGKDHPLVADLLLRMAELSFHQGQYARVEPLLQRVISIREATGGRDHPAIPYALVELARLRLAQNRLPEAVPLLSRVFTMSEQSLRQETLHFSESRLESFLELLRGHEEFLFSLLRAHPEDARLRRLASSVALLRKGRSVAELAGTSRTIYESLSPEDRNVFAQLREVRTQLAALELQGPGALGPEEHARRLGELEAQARTMESSLVKGSAPLRAMSALPPLEQILDRVAEALPRNGALVELIAYWDEPLISKPGAPPAPGPDPLRYLALVLLPDGSTRVVDLGPAEPIDRAAGLLRNALANRDASVQSSAQALYRLAFAPLVPLLGSTRRLFLAPDGQLGLIPFDALHDGRRFLIDTYDFTYLTSGRDLLPTPGVRPATDSVIVLADPDFSASAGEPVRSAARDPEQAERSASLESVLANMRAKLTGGSWAQLPGTRREAEAIQRLVPQARLFLGAEATKERLLHLPTPRVLHLATHGFFLEDAPVAENSRAVGHFGALGEDASAHPPEDPMLRSGVILAGARAAAPDSSDSAGSLPVNAVVTALELASLNLWGTELVVLSACDTGKGEARVGQGVYGLRRALLVAGAETVVMSLWKVNDDSTAQLMGAYYRNLLAGQGRAAALREAMRSLRGTHPHPHDWAPFIAVGRDTPLSTLAPSPGR